MSNSFGFGGTNATLVFRRYNAETHGTSRIGRSAELGIMATPKEIDEARAADGRKARADHGGRERPFDRLGNRPGAPRHGAELAFTYQGEAFGRRVKPLAEGRRKIIVDAMSKT